jgi:hypothetical protein
MNDDFALVREAFATSAPGRGLAGLGRIAGAAWRTSRVGRAAQSLQAQSANASAESKVGTIAAAVAIAAAMQPGLIASMPRTVAPDLPWPAIALVVVFAAVIAWQRAACVAAWRDSRFVSLFRR